MKDFDFNSLLPEKKTPKQCEHCNSIIDRVELWPPSKLDVLVCLDEFKTLSEFLDFAKSILDWGKQYGFYPAAFERGEFINYTNPRTGISETLANNRKNLVLIKLQVAAFI